MKNDPEEFDYEEGMEPPPIQRKKKRKKKAKTYIREHYYYGNNANDEIVYQESVKTCSCVSGCPKCKLVDSSFNIFELVAIVLLMPAYLTFCVLFVGLIFILCVGVHRIIFGHSDKAVHVIITMTICGILYLIIADYVYRLWKKIFG